VSIGGGWTGSGTSLLAGFGTSGVGPSGSVVRESVSLSVCLSVWQLIGQSAGC
jgi:hypothetical protein